MTTRASILILASFTPALADDWRSPKPADKVPVSYFPAPEGLGVTV